MCRRSLGFRIWGDPKQRSMGSSYSGGADAAAFAAFALRNIKIVRGILACAVASDRS